MISSPIKSSYSSPMPLKHGQTNKRKQFYKCPIWQCWISQLWPIILADLWSPFPQTNQFLADRCQPVCEVWRRSLLNDGLQGANRQTNTHTDTDKPRDTVFTTLLTRLNAFIPRLRDVSTCRLFTVSLARTAAATVSHCPVCPVLTTVRPVWPLSVQTDHGQSMVSPDWPWSVHVTPVSHCPVCPVLTTVRPVWPRSVQTDHSQSTWPRSVTVQSDRLFSVHASSAHRRRTKPSLQSPSSKCKK